jgi:hypothetical protein
MTDEAAERFRDVPPVKLAEGEETAHRTVEEIETYAREHGAPFADRPASGA